MKIKRKGARRRWRVKGAFSPLWSRRRAIGKGILLVLAVAVCLIPPVFLNSLMGYLPIFFLLLLLIASGIYLAVLKRSIVCGDLSVGSSCRRTETQEFCLRVENKSPLVCPLAVVRFMMVSAGSGGGTDTEFRLTLAPFEKREFRFSVTFAHLGEYSVGVGELRIRGLLGLVDKKLSGGGMRAVQVLPRQNHPGRLALSELVETEDSRARSSAAIDGADYTGVREYVFGDPIKNIHWKLSAHANGYMTKQTEVLGNSGVDVIVNLAVPAWTGEDGAFMYDALVESACAMTLYASENGMEGAVWFFDRSRRERNVLCTNIDDFDAVAGELPGLITDEREYPVDQLLNHAANSLYAKNNVVLCTAQVDEAVVRRLEQIKGARRHPVLVYVVPPGLTQRERDDRITAAQSLERQNIPCYVITDARELK